MGGSQWGVNLDSVVSFGSMAGDRALLIQQQIKVKGCATCIAFSPDGKSVLIGLEDTSVIHLSER